jgi:hypothetical protein
MTDICVDMKLLVHLVTALVFDDAFIWHGLAAKTLYAVKQSTNCI